MANLLQAEPNFAGLPGEILSKICEELLLTSQKPSEYDCRNGTAQCEDDNVSTASAQGILRAEAWKGLHSLVLTNRNCNAAAVEYLYRDIDLLYLAPDKEHRINIIVTLLTNRKLACMAKKLTFGEPIQRPDHNRSASLPPALNQMLWKTALGQGAYAEASWKNLQPCQQDMIIFEILLQHLENLHTIRSARCRWGGVPLSRLSTLSQNNFLSKLRYYECYNDDVGEPDPWHFYAVLARTKVETVSICRYLELERITDAAPQYSFTTVKSLKLLDCLLSKDVLSNALEQFPNLIDFSYTVRIESIHDCLDYCETLSVTIDERVTVPEVIRTLWHLRKKLESLEISVNIAWPDICGEYEIDNSVDEKRTIPSSFREFTRLQTLVIDRFDLAIPLSNDYIEIMGEDAEINDSLEASRPNYPSNFFEKLPKSLTTLTICRATSSIACMLAELPEMMENGVLPNMKTLILPFGESSLSEDAQWDIEHGFKGHAVELLWDDQDG